LCRSGERDYRLVVAGDGIERERWEAFCRERVPGRVAFLGFVARPQELANLIANADAFVHPNPHEPFGIAPLQAMASGLPLLAPDRGGVTTYANAGNAWLAPPDVESFAAALGKMLGDAPARGLRAQRALETAKGFRWEAVAPLFFDLYAELCAASPCAASTSTEALQRPDFSSERAQGFELAASRKISAAAERAFLWAARCFERARPIRAHLRSSNES